MSSSESWRRLLDAGAAVGEVTLTKANEIAKGLMADEAAARDQAWRDLDDLGRFGFKMGEQLADLARSQVRGRLRDLDALDQLIDLVGGLFSSSPHGEDSREEAADPEVLHPGEALRVEPVPAAGRPEADWPEPSGEHKTIKNKNKKGKKKARGRDQAVRTISKKGHAKKPKGAAEHQGSKKGKHSQKDSVDANVDRVLTLTRLAHPTEPL